MKIQITLKASKIIEGIKQEILAAGRPSVEYISGIMFALTSPELLRAQGLSKDEWVSCDDRLPEFKEADNNGYVDILCLSSDNSFNRQTARCDSLAGRSTVEYWSSPKPLPQPPINK